MAPLDSPSGVVVPPHMVFFSELIDLLIMIFWEKTKVQHISAKMDGCSGVIYKLVERIKHRFFSNPR